MDIGKGKINRIKRVFDRVFNRSNTYIPAMHTKVEDTFVSTTKPIQQEEKPTKEQVLARLREVDISESDKKYFEEYLTSDVKIAQAYKLLSDSKLYKNPDVLSSIYGILSIHSEETLKVRNAFVDKYLTTPELHQEEGISQKLGTLLAFASNVDRALMVDKIFSIPELYLSKDFHEGLDIIVLALNVPEKDEVFNKFLNSKTLYQDEEMRASIFDFLHVAKRYPQIEYSKKVIDYIEEGIVPPHLAIDLVKYSKYIEPENFRKLKNTVSPEVFNHLSQNKDDAIAASRIVPLYNKTSISEVPKESRKDVLRGIIKTNSDLFRTTEVLNKYFPLVPQQQEEYCTFLPELVNSIGVETKPITQSQVDKFFVSLDELSNSIKRLSDEEFVALNFSQKYPKDEFINDTLRIIGGLAETEKQKVCDYFGFELQPNPMNLTGFSLIGFPVNIDKPEKMAQISDDKTKFAIENLRENVIRFSENNEITSNNKVIGSILNEIKKALPEIHTMIGRSQYGLHDYDVFKHSVKVMQKIVQNPMFDNLNDSDKKVMLLASLFHDIRKAEAIPDPLHASQCSFDSYYLSKKFNLTEPERTKLYTLIETHEWLKGVNQRGISLKERIERYKDTAYDLQNGNIFELAKMFTEADLKSIQVDDGFYNKFGGALKIHSREIEKYIKELQATKPILPITKLPKASEVNSKITTINEDFSTNLKGVYKKDGLIIVRYNEVEDWEALGFDKGSISRGVAKDDYSSDETGTIKFISHWVYDKTSIANFNEFKLPDSEVLLSASYLHSPESKHLRSGLLLDVATENIHGGYKSDTWSGSKKTVNGFKKGKCLSEYYCGRDRTYFADIVKKNLSMSDEEYIAFVQKNANKSMSEIEPENVRNALISAYSSIYTNDTLGDYNEIYVSNPKIQACYASTGKVGTKDTISFVEKQADFLKDYAKQNDLLFFVFGD